MWSMRGAPRGPITEPLVAPASAFDNKHKEYNEANDDNNKRGVGVCMPGDEVWFYF